MAMSLRPRRPRKSYSPVSLTSSISHRGVIPSNWVLSIVHLEFRHEVQHEVRQAVQCSLYYISGMDLILCIALLTVPGHRSDLGAVQPHLKTTPGRHARINYDSHSCSHFTREIASRLTPTLLYNDAFPSASPPSHPTSHQLDDDCAGANKTALLPA
jgi:hypothetical protein